MTEGVALYKDGINPYDGDIFHESPVGLALYSQLIDYASSYLPAVFIIVDLVTGHLLYLTAVEYMKHLVGFIFPYTVELFLYFVLHFFLVFLLDMAPRPGKI